MSKEMELFAMMTGRTRIEILTDIRAEQARVPKAGVQHERVSGEPYHPDLSVPMVPGRIGVGILCYHDLHSVKTAVEAVLRFANPEYELFVFDNSEDPEIEEWVVEHLDAPYRHSRQNVGCWNARNRMAEYFVKRGCEFMIAQDQDVVWHDDAAAPMAEVFRRYPDTGCVTWKLAVETMGSHKWDETGAVWPPESPGMCCMFSLPALSAGDDPDLKGWHHGYGLVYRGDSDVCFSLWSKGYKTRVVMDGKCLVSHEHPHRGTHRLGARLAVEQAFSQRVFDERTRKYGWPKLA